MARVLIVDDEKSIRTTLAEFVREEGHDVLVAEDAAQALKLLVEQDPVVVVTDIILPRMTGVALLGSIKEISPDVQVLMITGEPTAETAAEAVRLGAFDYLSKPIARVDFKAAVASALRVTELAQERRRLEEENRRHQEHLEEEVEKKAGALRESEEKYRAVVEHASEAVFIVQDGVLPFANPSTVRLSGRSLKNLRTTQFAEWIFPEDRVLVTERYRRSLEGDDVPAEYEFRIVMPNDAIRWLELRCVLINWDGRPAVLNFANDVTERRQRESREAARQERTLRLDATLIQLAMNSDLYQGSMPSAVQAITEAAAQVLQVDRVSVWLYTEGRDAIDCLDLYKLHEDTHSRGMTLKRDDHPSYFQALAGQHVIVTNDAQEDPRTAGLSASYLSPLGITALLDAPIRLEGRLVGVVCHEHRDNQRQWEQEDVSFADSIAGLVALAIEAMHKKRAEEERERSEIRYRNIFEGSPTSLMQEDLSQAKSLLEDIRANGIDDLEEHLRNHPEVVDECIRRIRIVDANQAAVTLYAADSKEEILAAPTRIIPSALQAQFIPQLIAIWNGETYYETTSIDQRLDGNQIHVSMRWIAAPGYEETLERVLVSRIDITSTVEAKKSLQQALDGTIQAIGMTTETRDPYTAGHQRRVTELAVAIAKRMGLSKTIVEGTRVAGLMHDIGKLAVPAEILSKPSALNAMERLLIESHPQAAYDILQTVVFPWPIAEIVLQHHERIDGSGYPKGISEDVIRIEARILAVADTVEAMASHRPYRPALGIEAALEEIERSRGTKFDPEIVDACLSLFREREFRFRDHAS